MRCKEALKLTGPYVDGELAGAESSRLEKHLESCRDCTCRLSFIRGLAHEIASLPAIEPTAEESIRLMNRIRGEMAAPAAHKPAARRVRLATAALSLLVAVTVGVTWAIWGGGGPATNVEVTSVEGGEPSGETKFESTTGMEPHAGWPADAGTISTAMTRPSLVVSGNEYTPKELETFRNDLGTRLDFYSTYWYPAGSTNVQAAGIEQIRQDLVDDLSQQAQAAGRNPEELKKAIQAALAQEGDNTLLPCYAELAKMAGKDVWLVSMSGPEDYLLFPDPQLPPAMYLASRGGETSLKISEALLKELASRLAPYYGSSTAPLYPAETNAGPGVRGGVGQGGAANGQPPASTEGTGGTQGETLTPEQEERQRAFQTFLRDLAAQGNNLDLINALERLNYEQLLLLLQGNWSALAAEGVNLADFLAPPKRLWVIDAASDAVIWHP